VDKKKRN